MTSSANTFLLDIQYLQNALLTFIQLLLITFSLCHYKLYHYFIDEKPITVFPPLSIQ